MRAQGWASWEKPGCNSSQGLPLRDRTHRDSLPQSWQKHTAAAGEKEGARVCVGQGVGVHPGP